MFPRRIGNKTKFFSCPPPLFFPGEPFRGQFSQDDPIIILQRRLLPPNPMGGLSEGKTERKRKGNGGVVMVPGNGGRVGGIHQWKLDNNKCSTKRHGTRSQTALWFRSFAAELKQNWCNCCKTTVVAVYATNQLRGCFHGYNTIT